MSDEDSKVPLPDLENSGEMQTVEDAGQLAPSESDSFTHGASDLEAQLDASRTTGAAAQAAMAAEQVTRNLVGRTVAEVERDLILKTLKHCLGNRTHAANILGISIRTLRNKLNEYAADGTPIPPAGGGRPCAARA